MLIFPDIAAQQRAMGERLQATRKALNLTGHQMADAIGAGHSAYGNWEAGIRTPDLFALARLKRVFGVSIDWIVEGDPSGLTHAMMTKLGILS